MWILCFLLIWFYWCRGIFWFRRILWFCGKIETTIDPSFFKEEQPYFHQDWLMINMILDKTLSLIPGYPQCGKKCLKCFHCRWDLSQFLLMFCLLLNTKWSRIGNDQLWVTSWHFCTLDGVFDNRTKREFSWKKNRETLFTFTLHSTEQLHFDENF